MTNNNKPLSKTEAAKLIGCSRNNFDRFYVAPGYVVPIPVGCRLMFIEADVLAAPEKIKERQTLIELKEEDLRQENKKDIHQLMDNIYRKLGL